MSLEKKIWTSCYPPPLKNIVTEIQFHNILPTYDFSPMAIQIKTTDALIRCTWCRQKIIVVCLHMLPLKQDEIE